MRQDGKKSGREGKRCVQGWRPAAKNLQPHHIALEIRLECWGQDCLVSKGRKGKVLLEEEEFLCMLKPLKLSARGSKAPSCLPSLAFPSAPSPPIPRLGSTGPCQL